MLEKETNEYLKSQVSAMEGSIFLPDYLLDEAWSDTGRLTNDALAEF
jgi:hypothetical protein